MEPISTTEFNREADEKNSFSQELLGSTAQRLDYEDPITQERFVRDRIRGFELLDAQEIYPDGAHLVWRAHRADTLPHLVSSREFSNRSPDPSHKTCANSRVMHNSANA